MQIGSIPVDEKQLEADLRRVRRAVTKWAKENGYWHDTSFQRLLDQRKAAPEITDVLFLVSEGPLCIDAGLGFGNGECERGFEEVLQREGFTYGLETHYLFRIFPECEKRQEEYLALERWRWIKRLAKRRFYEIHSEVFEHFAKRPADLKNLSWRQYEEFLDSVFKNQGFVTELGPGQNDGGVDLRLYQNAAIPEMVTLVQAKRYTKNPVKLEAVAALFGHAVQQKATKGILATTSYFQPNAVTFAANCEQCIDLPTLELADATRTGGWCAEIAEHLKRFYETGANPPRHISERPPSDLVGRIVFASGGYNMTINYFAVIETDLRGGREGVRPKCLSLDLPRMFLGVHVRGQAWYLGIYFVYSIVERAGSYRGSFLSLDFSFKLYCVPPA